MNAEATVSIDRGVSWNFGQWSLTYNALIAAGVGAPTAARRAHRVHGYQGANKRIFARVVDLAALSSTELDERARRVGIAPEEFGRSGLRSFTARLEVERELRVEGLC